MIQCPLTSITIRLEVPELLAIAGSQGRDGDRSELIGNVSGGIDHAIDYLWLIYIWCALSEGGTPEYCSSSGLQCYESIVGADVGNAIGDSRGEQGALAFVAIAPERVSIVGTQGFDGRFSLDFSVLLEMKVLT